MALFDMKLDDFAMEFNVCIWKLYEVDMEIYDFERKRYDLDRKMYDFDREL